jgi:hypothetical protein
VWHGASLPLARLSGQALHLLKIHPGSYLGVVATGWLHALGHRTSINKRKLTQCPLGLTGGSGATQRPEGCPAWLPPHCSKGSFCREVAVVFWTG